MSNEKLPQINANFNVSLSKIRDRIDDGEILSYVTYIHFIDKKTKKVTMALTVSTDDAQGFFDDMTKDVNAYISDLLSAEEKKKMN